MVITLVFFITTCFFGKTEVVGHTILHGALLVFIVRGPGHYYQAPIRIHKSLTMRSLFAVANFVLLFAVLAFPYERLARATHAATKEKRTEAAHPRFDLPAGSPKMSVELTPLRDEHGGWALHIVTRNFIFAPQNAGKADVLGEGHAHLYVNGKKMGRVYGEWFHTTLGKGINRLKVTLNTNSHQDYWQDGAPVTHAIEVEEDRDVAKQHGHESH